MIGKLEVIFGPMYSGKTTRLLHMVSRHKKGTNKKVLLVNNNLDSRVKGNSISTHSFNVSVGFAGITIIKETNLENLYSKKEYMEADVIGIDEAQFFTDLVNFTLNAVEKDNKHLIVSGLIEDFQRKKFGSMLDIIPYADDVKNLKSLCGCGKDAIFTKRIVESKEQVVIGGAEAYIATCRSCFSGFHSTIK